MTKVLVVEDDTILREEFTEWLTYEGYEVVSAEDGIKAIAMAIHEMPDLTICDITMPGMDGYAVLENLRANPQTRAIPFLFMTARATDEDRQEGMALGADGYIVKPFSLPDFLALIKTLMEKKS